MRQILSGLILLCASQLASAQSVSLKVVQLDSAKLPDFSVYEGEYADMMGAKMGLDKIKQSIYAEGFMSCSVDSTALDSNILFAYLYAGQPLSWLELRPGTLPKEWVQEMNLSLGAYEGRKYDPASFQKLVNRILSFAENHGYPFAELKLDSVEFPKSDEMSASISFNQNRFFEMDTLSVNGDAKVSKKFLYSYLGFKPGDPYNESLVRKMQDRLQRLPFIQPTVKRVVYFTGNKVMIVLDLQERKTDQVDGIVGFAPNSNDNTKLLVTGEANVDLKNIMQRGIGFNMNWKNFQERSQQLRVGGVYPYILKSPVGVDANFEYVKYDTQFFTIKSTLGIRYLFDGTNYLKFYVQNESSALISTDTNSVRASKLIPNRNPVDSKSYGIALQIQKLDYVNNPRKGYRAHFDVNIGTRRILKDLRIEQVIFYNTEQKAYSIYDSIKLKSVQGSLAFNFEYFIPIKDKSTFVTGLSGKKLVAENIFFNDLYRFGGTKSLRGFNEESLLANDYQMASLEFRYLFTETSYFQLFANGARTIKQLDGVSTKDWPIGFGTGVSLQVKSGLLTLAYAVGREQGNPIQLSNARVHFGIINYL